MVTEPAVAPGVQELLLWIRSRSAARLAREVVMEAPWTRRVWAINGWWVCGSGGLLGWDGMGWDGISWAGCHGNEEADPEIEKHLRANLRPIHDTGKADVAVDSSLQQALVVEDPKHKEKAAQSLAGSLYRSLHGRNSRSNFGRSGLVFVRLLFDQVNAMARSPLASLLVLAAAAFIVAQLSSAFVPSPQQVARTEMQQAGERWLPPPTRPEPALAARVEEEDEGFDLRILAVLALPLFAVSWALFNVWRVAFRQVVRIGESAKGNAL
eukprot:Skav228787  [mRNA]  locus=scaffold589:692952:698497:- [translate_table: standard]